MDIKISKKRKFLIRNISLNLVETFTKVVKKFGKFRINKEWILYYAEKSARLYEGNFKPL